MRRSFYLIEKNLEEIMSESFDLIPKKERMKTIEENSSKVVGAQNGPLRDIDTGKFTEKKYRGVPKE